MCVSRRCWRPLIRLLRALPTDPGLAHDRVAALAGLVQDQPGGRFGAAVLDGRPDAGVGVGGDHDGGVAELVLDGLEIGPGGVGEGSGAVAEVVQPDRRKSGSLDELGHPLRAPACRRD